MQYIKYIETFQLHIRHPQNKFGINPLGLRVVPLRSLNNTTAMGYRQLHLVLPRVK